jgi:hypothetical protein
MTCDIRKGEMPIYSLVCRVHCNVELIFLDEYPIILSFRQLRKQQCKFHLEWIYNLELKIYVNKN